MDATDSVATGGAAEAATDGASTHTVNGEELVAEAKSDSKAAASVVDSPPTLADGDGAPQSAGATGDAAPPVSHLTMRQQLSALEEEQPECVFIVRKINKLGFESSDALTKYFSGFGDVKGVHVLHARTKKSTGAPDKPTKQRPSSLGFVVMTTPEEAARILQEGPEHTVQGFPVTVQAFEKHEDPGVKQAEAAGEEASQKPAAKGRAKRRGGADGAEAKKPRVAGVYVTDAEAASMDLDAQGSSRPSWLRGRDLASIPVLYSTQHAPPAYHGHAYAPPPGSAAPSYPPAHLYAPPGAYAAPAAHGYVAVR